MRRKSLSTCGTQTKYLARQTVRKEPRVRTVKGFLKYHKVSFLFLRFFVHKLNLQLINVLLVLYLLEMCHRGIT